MNWISERWYDICFYVQNWWRDRPFKKLWRGIWDRLNVIFFCVVLLVVGVWNPIYFRHMLLDAMKDTK